MALNYLWIAFFIIGFIVAVIEVIFFGKTTILSDMMNGMFSSAKSGFEISLGLTGIMTMWLGIMKVGERAGVIRVFAKFVSPLFRVFFKDIPKGNEAHGNIVMNLSATMLGLDNAATPLGLKAMSSLQDLNTDKERASDSQIMFLVLNTAGLTLIPTSVIAIRQTIALEQHVTNFNAADIFLPTLIATFIAFISGIIIVSIYQRINLLKLPFLIFIGGFSALIWLLQYSLSGLPADKVNSAIGAIGSGIILLIIVLFITAGMIKKQNVYDNFIEGAKEGFNVTIRIVPYLVGILIAISVFRTSGCMDFVILQISHLVAACGLNTDFVPALPVAFMKPMSGSGARGLMVDVMRNTPGGVTSFPSKVAAVIQGSTETTFYILAVYFGSVQIKNTRYAVVAGLLADIIGLIAAIVLSYVFFWHK